MILKKWNDLYISGALARCNPFVLQGEAGLRGPKVGAGAAGGHSGSSCWSALVQEGSTSMS